MSANYSVSESEVSEASENTYSIFLRIVEGIGFNLVANAGCGDVGDQRNNILVKASLNGVEFKVEGHSLTLETATIFNSNCIWECELDDIKRMKKDNRPVKLECFLKYGRSKNSSYNRIGSLLLPIKGVKTISNLTNTQIKLHWHKLGTLSAEWRQNKPEIYLLLMIVKKAVIENGHLEELLGKHKPSATIASNSEAMLSPNVSETVSMLQSQSNVYVKLLEQFGQIQVGNNPDVDCDIFSVTLTFKQIKNVIKLLDRTQTSNRGNCFVFQYDFLGSNSNVEIMINSNDCYTINEKISISFRSSLNSLRLYFQRIFYIPINLYYNGMAIANYRFNISKLLPDDISFNNFARLWTKIDSFNFDRLHQILSPRVAKPLVDFIFTIQLISPYSKRNNYEILPLNETFVSCERDLATPQVEQAFRSMPFGNCLLTDRHTNSLEMGGKLFKKNAIEQVSHNNDVMASYAKSRQESSRDDVTEKDELKSHILENPTQKETNTVCVGTEDEPSKTFNSVAINTDPCDVTDHEELTIKVVQELEDWKSQQMEYFINEFKRNEEIYRNHLQNEWEQKRVILQARLEAKMLEQAQVELSASATKNRDAINIADTIKRDIESSYAKKLFELESEMQRLKLDMQQRGAAFEIKNKQVQIDNTCLEREKADLKERIEKLEKQLTTFQDTHVPAEQLKNVLKDMHKQSERIVAVEKSCNFYKEQWAHATHEVKKLKVKLLKSREEEYERKSSQNTGIELSLEEILNEEQEILKSDRSELKAIKLSLFNSSDSSSADEPTLRG